MIEFHVILPLVGVGNGQPYYTSLAGLQAPLSPCCSWFTAPPQSQQLPSSFAMFIPAPQMTNRDPKVAIVCVLRLKIIVDMAEAIKFATFLV